MGLESKLTCTEVLGLATGCRKVERYQEDVGQVLMELFGLSVNTKDWDVNSNDFRAKNTRNSLAMNWNKNRLFTLLAYAGTKSKDIVKQGNMTEAVRLTFQEPFNRLLLIVRETEIPNFDLRHWADIVWVAGIQIWEKLNRWTTLLFNEFQTDIKRLPGIRSFWNTVFDSGSSVIGGICVQTVKQIFEIK